MYPISLEDIRQFSDGKVDDLELMTKYSQIQARNRAAQNFLAKEMHFQEDEISIQTLKMAANWSSKIMWIEIGETNVRRLINRSITLKNPKIQLITYFPACLWNKRKDLNDILKEKRKVTPDLRYQILVGKNDLILKTKMVGEHIWQVTPIEEFLPFNKNLNNTITHNQSPIYKRTPKRNITPEKSPNDKKKVKGNEDSNTM